MPHSKGFAHRREQRTADAVTLGEVVDGLMAEEAFSRGMPIAALASQWPVVMGKRLAAETEPARLEDGVLTVRATDGPWGAQARFLAEQIRLNANRALGSQAVRSVRVVIDPRAGGNR
jgi:predicted nucleic acid-binding Zn ribbon protein